MTPVNFTRLGASCAAIVLSSLLAVGSASAKVHYYTLTDTVANSTWNDVILTNDDGTTSGDIQISTVSTVINTTKPNSVTIPDTVGDGILSSFNWTFSVGAKHVVTKTSDLQTSFAASSAVPEPMTWMLLLLGFAGLGLAGYRKSHAALSAH